MKKSTVKRVLGASVFALVLSWAMVGSAVKNIEPEECRTVCYYILGIPITCYEVCF